MIRVLLSAALSLALFIPANAVLYLAKKDAGGGGSIPVIEGSTVASTVGTTVTNLTISTPSEATTGRLGVIIAFADTRDAVNGTRFNALSGWTQQLNYGDSTSDTIGAVYTRDLDGTEPASENISWAISSFASLKYFAISGTDSSNPVGASGIASSVAGSALTVPSINTLANNSLVFGLSHFDGQDGSPFSLTSGGPDWSFDIQQVDGSGADPGSGISSAILTKEVSSSGATGSFSVSSSGSISDGFVGSMIEIRSE